MKKNVLMILPTFNYAGGMESFVINNMESMRNSEFNVDIISHDVNAEEYVKIIEDAGGKVYKFPKFSIKNLKEIKNKYENILNKRSYDIIHCHMANAAFLYLKIAKEKNIPIRIIHSHQNKASDILLNAIRNIPLLKIGKKYANENVACSIVAGDFLFKQAYKVLRNTIDYTKYKYNEKNREILRSQLGLSDKDIVVGHTGRLVPMKNQEFLIKLFANLTNRNDNYKLVLVGDGDDLLMLQELSRSLNVSEKIMFLGSRKDIPELLSAFDLFVFPSKYEGLGISLLEAQVSGMYCLASKEVTAEVDISPLVEHLPLKVGLDKWVEQIENRPVLDRAEIYSKLNFEYDKQRNLNLLVDVYREYINKYEKIK